MKVLLTKPATESSKPWYFPSGLGYIARAILDAGHEVTVIDPEIEQWDLSRHCSYIANTKYDILGISALINKYKYVCHLAEASKISNPHAKVVLGGNITGPIWELLLHKSRVDICVIGEGEKTIQELLGALEGQMELEEVQGIAFRKNGQPFQTPLRMPIEHLDSIPFPAYEVFPMESYISTPGKIANLGYSKRDLSMITSRGCPYNCTFCYRPSWEKVRSRSPENVSSEIQYLIKNYGIDSIVFNDELTLRHKSQIFKLCDVMDKIGIFWGCVGRVNVVSADTLKKMYDAKCRWMTYGLESGSQAILNEMNKKTTVDQAKNAILWTKRAGIHTNPTFILGFPSESHQTAMETVKFMSDSNLYPETLFFATPYPGTELFKQAVQRGLISDVEEYLLSIDGKDAHSLIINLTSMSNHELLALRDEVIRNISECRGNIFKRSLKIIRKEGLNIFLSKIMRRLRSKL